MKKRKLNLKSILLLIVIIILILSAIVSIPKILKEKIEESKQKEFYIASTTNLTKLYNLEFQEQKEIVRGTKITTDGKEIVNEVDNKSYYKIKHKNQEYLVETTNLVDELNETVLETTMYVRTAATLYKEKKSSSINGLAPKGAELEIIGFDKILENGEVNKYEVNYNGEKSYIYARYTVSSKEESLKHYDYENTYQVHLKRTNTWGGGSAGNLDFYPVEKSKFEDNVMPDEVRSLYINASSISYVDEYISIAKEANINAFVVDIKDNTAPAYPAEAMKKYSQTNYNNAINSYEEYKNAIQKLKDNGFYVIGRITTFKDSFYAKDHPEDTILNTTTNSAYNHDGSYWPSAFKRSVWEFNVELAKESVTEIGFNEIQFDYVRFPDRTYNDEKNGVIDFQNQYNEEKAQAIQNFLRYACDEIHQVNAYVSADVFGESAHNYVTGYGQYWGAISNVVDVISGMPYPELFNKYEYGFNEPVWTVPYDLLKFWGSNYVVKQQENIPTPAIVRTWIQAYDITWRDPKTTYDADMVSKQIKGLYDSGLTGGYITWNGGSSISKYKQLIPAFKKEY